MTAFTFILGSASLCLSALRSLPSYLHGCLRAVAARGARKERERAEEAVGGWVRERKGEER